MDSHRDLIGRVCALLGTNPEVLIDRLRELNKEHDKLRAGVDHLEEMRKVVLAECMEEARGDGKTVQQIENEARMARRYREHLKDLKTAKEALAEKAGEYYAARNALEWAERLLSFAQTEIRLTR